MLLPLGSIVKLVFIGLDILDLVILEFGVYCGIFLFGVLSLPLAGLDALEEAGDKFLLWRRVSRYSISPPGLNLYLF